MGVFHDQPVGDHGAATDVAQQRVVVLVVDAEVGSGLHDLRQIVSDELQVARDVGAVPEKIVEELNVAGGADVVEDEIAKAVQHVCLVFLDEQIGDPGQQPDECQSGGDRQGK